MSGSFRRSKGTGEGVKPSPVLVVGAEVSGS